MEVFKCWYIQSIHDITVLMSKISKSVVQSKLRKFWPRLEISLELEIPCFQIKDSDYTNYSHCSHLDLDNVLFVFNLRHSTTVVNVIVTMIFSLASAVAILEARQCKTAGKQQQNSLEMLQLGNCNFSASLDTLSHYLLTVLHEIHFT